MGDPVRTRRGQQVGDAGGAAKAGSGDATTHGRHLPGELHALHCRFEVTPPRHFIYPAILLVLAEQPRHGYRLVDPLVGLGFGKIDRASVYRGLSDLERDGLVESWEAPQTAGPARQVYATTELGRRVLEQWMAVIAEERDCLERALRRYRRAVTDG